MSEPFFEPKMGSDADPNALVNEYHTFVIEILRRLSAVSESLNEIVTNPDHPENWKNCDFCWLQMRKVCEYLTLALVLAHHRDVGCSSGLSEWKPKELLRQVDALSPHPRPIPILPVLLDQGESRQITPIAQPLGADVISNIYGRCNDLLHVGTLKRILNSRMPAYDIAQMQQWVVGFTRLMRNHTLMLPKVERAIVCISRFGESDLPEMFLIAGEVGAMFDMTGLPVCDLANL